MYFAAVVLLTIVLPVVSVLAEHLMRPEAALLALVGKWFVFWACGLRLLLAGASQAVRPEYTAESILKINDPAAGKVVSELGYANITMGLAGVISLLLPGWVTPVGFIAGLFLLLDGLKHMANSDRGAKENLALVTDLVVALAVAAYLVWTFSHSAP